MTARWGPSVSISTIRPIPAQRLTFLEAIEPVARISGAAHRWQDFTEGRRLQAKVEARLPDGSYRIVIEGRQLQVKLPWQAAIGETMELALLAREPGPKFLLLERTGADSPPNTATLSSVSRLLGNLAQARARVSDPPLAPAPALSAPPAESRHAMESLRQVVSMSGLFYETHLAQWIAGKRPIGKLLEEPQNRFSPPAKPGKTAARAGLPLVTDSPAEAIASADSHRMDTGLERLAATVQQQLGLLETGQFSWRGEIWPGQPMRWDIAAEPDPERPGSRPRRWRTKLALTLPAIGGVTALIELDPPGVYLSLRAADEESVKLMHADRSAVTGAMQAAGLRVTGLEIRHDAGQ